MNSTELKDYLTTNDIITFVTKGLGSGEPLYDTEDNPIFQTICHNAPGEGKHKLFYYPETKLFHCYTECGENFDIFDLIIKTGKAANFISSYQYLRDFFGLGFQCDIIDFEKEERTADWDLINKYENLNHRKEKKDTTQILPHNLVNLFQDITPQEWEQEGISAEAMSSYNIRIDSSASKIIIPHYNREGELIGIRGRSYDPEDIAKGKKYCPIYIEGTLYNHPLGSHLYGLSLNAEAIKRAKQVVIFEGEKSVLKAQTFYKENNFTVAACGSTISDEQVNLLLSLGVNEIIIAFDKENDNLCHSEATGRYRDKLIKLASKFSPYVNTYYVLDLDGKVGYKDSPIDQGKENLEYLLKRKILVPSVSTIYNSKGKKPHGRK